MRAPTATELLQVWEKTLGRSLVDKSIHLLALACSVADIKLLTQLSIGERDARLFRLRKWMFGSRLINLAKCPNCSESVEWEMDVNNLQLEEVNGFQAPKQFELKIEDYQIRYRLPNSEDLIRAMYNQDYQDNPVKVLMDCILEAKSGSRNCDLSALPDSVLTALDEQISLEDPQANINMLLDCPACSHKWEVPFDIVSYLWVEIDNWAKHMFQEIYVLASAFKWSEKDILEMSPMRRKMYLQMLK